MLKNLVRSSRFRAAAATVLAGWFRLVRATCRGITEPPDYFDREAGPKPMIITTWHGEHFMLPFVRPAPHWPVKAMISRSQDGELNVLVCERLGIGAIRASAGRTGDEVRRRGGVSGFVAALKALRDGTIVVLTADLPKGPAKIAGEGIVQIARRSGAPIIPVATATTNRKRFRRAWDSAALNLPFGRFAVVCADPIVVPADADEAALETYRRRVESELNRVTARAYEIVGGRDV